MLLRLLRIQHSPKSTIGELWIVNKETNEKTYECFTLEDTVRPFGIKIAGKTAIPEGTYKVVFDWSDRHRCVMLHVLDVPNFEGIRFDIANKPEDVEGCIAVGRSRSPDWIGSSTPALKQLSTKLLEVYNKEEIWIEIKKGEREVVT